MIAHRVHLIIDRRWLFTVLLTSITLTVTACGSELPAQAAIPGARGGAPRLASQDSLPATSASTALSSARESNGDSVADTETVIYRVGQTATVGDLRVTLDRVAASAGEAGNLPDAGQRFLLVYITVENTGEVPQPLSSFSTSVTDTAGRHFFVEPLAGRLSVAQRLELTIPPGGRTSGNRGYMLPVNAGDLIWTAQDASRNRARFAIMISDLVALRQR